MDCANIFNELEAPHVIHHDDSSCGLFNCYDLYSFLKKSLMWGFEIITISLVENVIHGSTTT